MTHLEIEVKFPVRDLHVVENRLHEMGAILLRPRVHEMNLRFDTNDGRLGRLDQVLRLRRSDDVRMAYKGKSDTRTGVAEREEIEFTVGDFETAQKFLEALGYQVFVAYEKFRTVYRFGRAEIMLDETPIGNFVEIEAHSRAEICDTAGSLDLDWSSRLTESYLALFERLRTKMGFKDRDMTFDNLRVDWLSSSTG